MRRGRPWSAQATATAIDLLATRETERLGSVERARLLSRLRGMSAEDVIRAPWGRAGIRRYCASVSFLERIRQEVTLTGSSAVDADPVMAAQFGLAVARRDEVDGYVTPAAAQPRVGWMAPPWPNVFELARVFTTRPRLPKPTSRSRVSAINSASQLTPVAMAARTIAMNGRRRAASRGST
jgi:hypothetical protein